MAVKVRMRWLDKLLTTSPVDNKYENYLTKISDYRGNIVYACLGLNWRGSYSQ